MRQRNRFDCWLLFKLAVTYFLIIFTNCTTHSQREIIEPESNYSDTMEVVINSDARLVESYEDKSKITRRVLIRRDRIGRDEFNEGLVKSLNERMVSDQKRELKKGRKYEKEYTRIEQISGYRRPRIVLNAFSSLLCYENILVAHELAQQHPQNTRYSRQIAAIECFVNNSGEEPVDFELGMVPIVRANSSMHSTLYLSTLDIDDDEELFSIKVTQDIVATPPHTKDTPYTTTDIPFYPFQEVLVKDDTFYKVGEPYTTRKYTIPPKVTYHTIAFWVTELPSVGCLTSLYPARVQAKIDTLSHCMQMYNSSMQLNFNPLKNKLCYPREKTNIKTQQMLYYEVLVLTKMNYRDTEFQIAPITIKLHATAKCIWKGYNYSYSYWGQKTQTFVTETQTGIASTHYGGPFANYYTHRPTYSPYTLNELKKMPRGIAQRLACFLEPIRSGTGVSLQDGQCAKVHPEDDLLRLHTNITLNLSKVFNDLISITGMDNESAEILD
jgi:hypothetical protein